MPKGKRNKETNNDGRDGAPSLEETRETRMRMFDELPPALRAFLANEAAYDHAVTPFWQARKREWTRGYLTSTEQRNVMGEAAERYGLDHPQAVRFTKLMPKNDSQPRYSINNPKKRKRRTFAR